jgi:hypothetical protein
VNLAPGEQFPLLSAFFINFHALIARDLQFALFDLLAYNINLYIISAA